MKNKIKIVKEKIAPKVRTDSERQAIIDAENRVDALQEESIENYKRNSETKIKLVKNG